MKITHMVNLQHIMDQDSYLGPSAYSESQASLGKLPPAAAFVLVSSLKPIQAYPCGKPSMLLLWKPNSHAKDACLLWAATFMLA